MGAEHTSVPRWADVLPSVDPTARAVALLGFGPSGTAVLPAWVAAVPADVAVWIRNADEADDAALALLAEHIATARVGWRLVLAGPEIDVLAARAVAARHGVLDAEISTVVTEARHRRVFCPHCRTTTTTAQPVGGTAACEGCGRGLFVYAHVSRRAGAYLGFMVDAAEVA